MPKRSRRGRTEEEPDPLDDTSTSGDTNPTGQQALLAALQSIVLSNVPRAKLPTWDPANVPLWFQLVDVQFDAQNGMLSFPGAVVKSSKCKLGLSV